MRSSRLISVGLALLALVLTTSTHAKCPSCLGEGIDPCPHHDTVFEAAKLQKPEYLASPEAINYAVKYKEAAEAYGASMSAYGAPVSAYYPASVYGAPFYGAGAYAVPAVGTAYEAPASAYEAGKLSLSNALDTSASVNTYDVGDDTGKIYEDLQQLLYRQPGTPVAPLFKSTANDLCDQKANKHGSGKDSNNIIGVTPAYPAKAPPSAETYESMALPYDGSSVAAYAPSAYPVTAPTYSAPNSNVYGPPAPVIYSGPTYAASQPPVYGPPTAAYSAPAYTAPKPNEIYGALPPVAQVSTTVYGAPPSLVPAPASIPVYAAPIKPAVYGPSPAVAPAPAPLYAAPGPTVYGPPTVVPASAPIYGPPPVAPVYGPSPIAPVYGPPTVASAPPTVYMAAKPTVYGPPSAAAYSAPAYAAPAYAVPNPAVGSAASPTAYSAPVYGPPAPLVYSAPSYSAAAPNAPCAATAAAAPGSSSAAYSSASPAYATAAAPAYSAQPAAYGNTAYEAARGSGDEDNVPSFAEQKQPQPTLPADPVSISLAYKNFLQTPNTKKYVPEDRLAFGHRQLPADGRIYKQIANVAEEKLFTVDRPVVELKSPAKCSSSSYGGYTNHYADDNGYNNLEALERETDEASERARGAYVSYSDLGYGPVGPSNNQFVTKTNSYSVQPSNYAAYAGYGAGYSTIPYNYGQQSSPAAAYPVQSSHQLPCGVLGPTVPGYKSGAVLLEKKPASPYLQSDEGYGSKSESDEYGSHSAEDTGCTCKSGGLLKRIKTKCNKHKYGRRH